MGARGDQPPQDPHGSVAGRRRPSSSFLRSPADLPAVQALFNGQTELIFRLNGGDRPAIKLYGIGAYLAVTEEVWAIQRI